jgi:hypothetical protein
MALFTECFLCRQLAAPVYILPEILPRGNLLRMDTAKEITFIRRFDTLRVKLDARTRNLGDRTLLEVRISLPSSRMGEELSL